MHFHEALKANWKNKNSLICVGLDPDLEKFPAFLPRHTNQIFDFNKAIIDATADLVCAFKPQIAFYSAYGAEAQLSKTIDYIHKEHPGIPVILDAKRGDIGSTATKYAEEAFKRYKADAVTVNPYLGFDSVAPFLKYEDKGIIILCRTSNPSAPDFQDLLVDGKKLYLRVAEKIVNEWNCNGNCSMVIGATYPNELQQIRALAPEIPFLVPGSGAQGGNVQEAVSNGIDEEGTGIILSSSRSILYASDRPNSAEAAKAEALALKNAANRHRAK